MKILWAASSSASHTIFKVKKNINTWDKTPSIRLSSQSLKYVDCWNLHKTNCNLLMEKTLLLIQRFSGISGLCIIGTGESKFQPKIYKMSCSSQLFTGIYPVCGVTETPCTPWGSRDHLLSNTGQTIAGQGCRAPSNTVQVHSHL